MKSKEMKKKIIAAISLLLALSIAVGLIVYLVNNGRKPVAVYNIDQCGLSTMYMGDNNTTYGMVSTDKLQVVNLSDTQQVTGIKVQQGQSVKAGQSLITFDTTLSELSLERKRLEVEKTKMRLQEAQDQLKEIKQLKPMVVRPGASKPVRPQKPADSNEAVGSLEDKKFVYQSGAGTHGNPAIYWIREGLTIDPQIMESILKEKNSDELYTILEAREDNDADGEIISRFGVVFMRQEVEIPQDPTDSTDPVPPTPGPTLPPTDPPEPSDGPTNPSDSSTDPSETAPSSAPTDSTDGTTGPIDENHEESVPAAAAEQPLRIVPVSEKKAYMYSFRLFEAPEKKTPEPPAPVPDVNMGSGYTASEIAQMRGEKEQEIKELQFTIKMSDAEYKIMQKEFDTGEVVSEVDGYVISVLTEEEARASGEPIIKVSAGGVYEIHGTVSELKLPELQLGQEVSVNSWDTGEIYTGTISQIGDYPVKDQLANEGNPNSSSYPFTVTVDQNANLQTGAYVEMTYTSGDTGMEDLYLDSAFLRQEDGAYYVFVKGAEERLEKRFVQVAGTIYEGSYTVVTEGLSADESIAFPYGKNVKQGAKTQEGTAAELYSSMY